MPTKDHDKASRERLTPEDIDALRRRFVDIDGKFPDVRAHGAVTIGDLAEAFGVPPEEVARVLDGYRAERALRGASSRGLDQKGMLALAAILFGTAFGIYRYGPRKLSPEENMARMEEKMEEIKAERKRNPRIHYPITAKVQSGALPPFGFDVTFRGRLTVTNAPPTQGAPVRREEATAALTEALMNAYEVARKAETSAPEPIKPLPKKPSMGWGYEDIPGALAYSIGTSGAQTMGYVNLDPSVKAQPNSTSATGVPPSREFFQRVAASITEMAAQSQEETLKPPKMPTAFQSVPAGYQVEVSGRSKSATTGMQLRVLPFDPVRVEGRLREVVEKMLLHDIDPEAAHFYGSMSTMPKAPKVSTIEVTITGPLRPVVLKLPQEPTAEYPTAADVIRASEQMVRGGVHKAAMQVAELNAKTGVKP